MFNKINTDIANAMRARDTLRLETLRMMKSKILLVNARGDLPEADIIKILTKYANSLKEEASEAQKVGRPETAEHARAELKIVEEYLPRQLTEDEIKAAVEKVVQELGATSMKDMGRAMKEVLARHPGVDGAIVSRLVKEALSKNTA
ncbi:MAG: GatB/YqeY domain-containing protein [Candidatus Margulisiibacteriota bacterium]